jgi:hypothetical protein
MIFSPTTIGSTSRVSSILTLLENNIVNIKACVNIVI